MISSKGLALIKQYESLALIAYPDPGSISGEPWTIGYGHTGGVGKGDTCTIAQAEKWLLEDCAKAEGYISRGVLVGLNQDQRDALISFIFNVGGTQFKSSTLLKKLNKSDFEGAALEFRRWNHNEGKVMDGLTKRRKEEEELFSRS